MDLLTVESCPALVNGSAALAFAQLIQTLTIAQCALGNPDDYPPDRTDEILGIQNPVFDFIIVGGGSGGCVTASRLSEVDDWTVLLVEAGENPSPSSDIPGLVSTVLGSSEDYSYQLEVQETACLGAEDKRCVWPKGKALGGSSMINAMLFIQGNRRDFDEWEAAGNVGWGYDEVLPYFKKSEALQPGLIGKPGTEDIGVDGLLPLRKFNNTKLEVADKFLQAGIELGLPELKVFTVDEEIGCGKTIGNADFGRRVNVAKAFLGPAKNRTNLYVMRNAQAEHLVIEDGVAVGVNVTLKDGRRVTVRAGKEMILSAGSMGTPQILMLSGIGPAEHLDELGIEVIANLSVGKNLQDHPSWTGLRLTYRNESRTVQSIDVADEFYKLLIHGNGFLANVGGVDSMCFISVVNSTPWVPDLQFNVGFATGGMASYAASWAEAQHLNEELTNEIVGRAEEDEIFIIANILLRPKSVGELKLRSIDPTEPPLIYANYLADPDDVSTMLEGVNFVKSLLETSPFKDLGISLDPWNITGCEHAEPDSRDYWECSLRHLTWTAYHYVGTTKMGPQDEPSAVVDPELKVHGISGLRVIDASIMPNVTSGNTHAPTLMIAEKGSDMIKAEWLAKK